MKETLLNEMREYSNLRIMNTISQSGSFSEDVVEAAKAIAIERNLLTEDKMSLMQDLPKFKRMAVKQIQDGVAPKAILQGLIGKGLPESFAKDVMNDAARSVTIQEKAKENEGGGMSVWTIIVIVLIVIRIILRMAQG